MKHKPQQERKIETKKKIVDAAMALFSSKGYYQTSSKEIAREAGVSTGSFYTYFIDKKDALKYILNTYIQEVISDDIAPVDDPKSPMDKKTILKDIIVKSFNFHNFSIGFYQQVTTLSIADEEISVIFEEYKTTTLTRISKLLEHLAPELSDDPRAAASIIIHSAIEGTIHMVKFSKTDRKEDVLIDELVRFIDSYLAALSSDKIN